jgi:hypothetical protein
MSFEQDQSNTMPAPVPPAPRVSWSRERCWHGETVKIRVRCSFVPDGTRVDLAIQPQGGGGGAIVNIPNLAINGGVLDHDYVVDWSAIVIPGGAVAFEVIATLPAFNNLPSPPSAPMIVDLIPPLFSA